MTLCPVNSSLLWFPKTNPLQQLFRNSDHHTERQVIEDALQKHLGNESDMDLLLRRFDHVGRDMARHHRDLELLSEAFGRYMRLWFVAHAPSAGEAGKAAARAAGEVPYKQFAQHLGAQFKQGHRFIDDFPAEAFAGDDDVK